jgi:hypothetical protein
MLERPYRGVANDAIASFESPLPFASVIPFTSFSVTILIHINRRYCLAQVHLAVAVALLNPATSASTYPYRLLDNPAALFYAYPPTRTPWRRPRYEPPAILESESEATNSATTYL